MPSFFHFARVYPFLISILLQPILFFLLAVTLQVCLGMTFSFFLPSCFPLIFSWHTHTHTRTRTRTHTHTHTHTTWPPREKDRQTDGWTDRKHKLIDLHDYIRISKARISKACTQQRLALSYQHNSWGEQYPIHVAICTGYVTCAGFVKCKFDFVVWLSRAAVERPVLTEFWPEYMIITRDKWWAPRL